MSQDGYHYWNATPAATHPAHQQNEGRSRLLSSVLPEVSSDTAAAFGDHEASDAFHLNVAAHDDFLLTRHPDDGDFLRSGVDSPNEVQPPLTQLKRLSLDDIQDPLQLQGEPLDLNLYLHDYQEPPLMDGALGFTPHPYTSQMAHHANTFSENIDDAAGRDPYHVNNINGTNQMARPPPPPPILHHSTQFPPMLLPNHIQQDLKSPSYPRDPALHSNPHPHPASESQDIPTSNSSSRKGYRHRHERVYGLPEEQQKKRSQILNNEASQLYRQRKTTKVQDIETQMKQEEERNLKLRMIYKQLQTQKQRLSLDQLPNPN
ncbi:uncharacterized protein LOC135199649 [Macrobrachium nipponense]|uniref:uncharacterized protein LOC135199649 n=1 Tax=Macrobrachium nipponense TaxID=159736 RepID=UPI0030C7D108